MPGSEPICARTYTMEFSGFHNRKLIAESYGENKDIHQELAQNWNNMICSCWAAERQASSSPGHWPVACGKGRATATCWRGLSLWVHAIIASVITDEGPVRFLTQASDVPPLIFDAKFLLNDNAYPSTGPHLTAKAIRL